MANWFVKDLSKITGVSVQTLHHYDRIGLLKPSLRQSNRYRLYSEKDLVRLQQIIALKFFGFELSQIEKLLSGDLDILEHFTAQAKFLAEKANSLNIASQSLTSIIADCKANKSIPWENVIKSIEVYHMTQQLGNHWIANVLSPDELKQYADFDVGLKQRFTSYEKQDWEGSWKKVIEEINNNLHLDPKSQKAMELGKKVMDLINTLYGKEHANLKHAIWNKGFKEGHAGGEHSLSPEIISWMDKAIDAFYRSRIYAILDQAELNPTQELLKRWNELMEEMYGHSDQLRQELIQVALKDERVGPNAKLWLNNL